MDEDQEIAFGYDAAVVVSGVVDLFGDFFMVDHISDLVSDTPRHQNGVVGGAWRVHGFEPFALVLNRGFFNHRPQIDSSGHVFLKGDMGQTVVHPIGPIPDKGLIHNGKDGLR